MSESKIQLEAKIAALELTLDEVQREKEELKEELEQLDQDYIALKEDYNLVVRDRDMYRREYKVLFERRRNNPNVSTTGYKRSLLSLRSKFLKDGDIRESVTLDKSDFDLINETLCVEV